MKLSRRDVILITVAVFLGGPGTAKVILSIASKYLEKKLHKFFKGNLEAETFRVVLNRLKRDGLLEKGRRNIWGLTRKGREAAKLVERRMSYEEFKVKRRKTDTIIIFDIPENQRKKRDYLRIELRALGFRPLQKSVWMGGGPLPMEFAEYLKDTRLLSYIHIFTIKNFGTTR